MNNLIKIINLFLENFATKVREDDNVELMIDNHFCIEYNNEEYYIPKNNMLYSKDDELLVKLLKNTYHL